jgi:hypothetical protein
MSIRTLTKLTLVAIAAAVIPACGSSDKNRPPLVVDWTPAAPNNTAVGRMPNIIVKFDRAMNAATVTNTSNWAVLKSGATGGVTLSSVEYLPALFEARIIPNVLLDAGAVYGIVVGGALTSAEGIPVGGSFVLDTFTTNSVAGSTISWGGVTNAGPGANPGEITLVWAKATEGADDVTNYDIFLSTVAGGEDLLVRTGSGFVTTPNLTGVTLTGLTPGTLYFMKVQPRSGISGNVLTSLAEVSTTAAP